MTFRHSAASYDHNRIMSVSDGARGFIETRGHVGAIGSTDAMVKTAGGELLGQEYVEAGYVSVTVCGDIGTLQAATDAGVAVRRVGEPVARHAIPNPFERVASFVSGARKG